MILSVIEIKRQYELGNIYISDFDEKRLGPNSYNLRLDNKLLVYTNPILDMKKDNPVEEIIIPKEGYILEPGRLYLGKTIEYTKSGNFAPMIEGRSSVARLGIKVHLTAGFGDVGNELAWTLEIEASKHVRIYAGVEICQIYYHTVLGDTSIKYNGKYQNSTDIGPSKMYKDFK